MTEESISHDVKISAKNLHHMATERPISGVHYNEARHDQLDRQKKHHWLIN